MTARGIAEFTRVSEIVQRATLDVPEPERQKLASDIEAQLSQLPTVITDPQTYVAAKEYLPRLKQAEDRVLNFFKDIKDAAFKAHKAITTKETEQLKPIKTARDRLARLIYDYEAEENRKRRQRELEEQKRLQEQQQAAAVEEAVSMAEAGAPEMAEQILEQAIAAPPPVVVLPPSTVTVAGVSTAENWKWRYVNDSEEHAMRLLPREYCCPDESKITKVVKAMKGGTRIPGIEVYDAGTVRVRG